MQAAGTPCFILLPPLPPKKQHTSPLNMRASDCIGYGSALAGGGGGFYSLSAGGILKHTPRQVYPEVRPTDVNGTYSQDSAPRPAAWKRDLSCPRLRIIVTVAFQEHGVELFGCPMQKGKYAKSQ